MNCPPAEQLPLVAPGASACEIVTHSGAHLRRVTRSAAVPCEKPMALKPPFSSGKPASSSHTFATCRQGAITILQKLAGSSVCRFETETRLDTYLFIHVAEEGAGDVCHGAVTRRDAMHIHTCDVQHAAHEGLDEQLPATHILMIGLMQQGHLLSPRLSEIRFAT
jgi:hypothetical protein